MEIKDRNMLLQQFFGAQKASFISETPMDGFADMLKADKIVSSEKNEAADFITTKKINVSESVNDKEVVFKKDNAVKKKQIEKSEQENSPSQAKEKVDNREVDNDDAVSYVEKSSEPTSDKKELNSDKEVVAHEQETNVEEVSVVEGLEANVSESVISSRFDVLPILDSENANSVTAVVVDDVLVPMPTTDKAVVEDEMFALPQEEIKLSGENKEAVTTEAVVFTEEDALLVEQARYLDDKIATPKKLKVDVDVKEEKVAASINKDVLQNRFEIDSIFQKVEDESLVELNAVSDEFVDVDVLQENFKPTVTYNKQVDHQVFANVVANSQETAVNTTSDAVNLSISGKEVVFETSNALRQDVFTKINESSSRDAFKGIAKDVVEQVKINITKSAIKGVDTIDIQLKPEDLGKIQIKMYIGKDGKLQADVISSRPETMDMLQKDVSGLVKAFNDAGYDADNRSFNFSFQGENQAKEQQNGDSGLLKFIGDTLEQEAESAVGNDNLAYDPILGLNIRV